MKITLKDEDIELNPSFKNISRMEEAVGSVFGFALRLKKGEFSFTDVVNVYYFLQEGAYSQDTIAKKVMSDGMGVHIGQVGEIFAKILMSDDDGKKQEAQESQG
jgi:hypothetical protein